MATLQTKKEENGYALSRFLYILEAMLEYFVSIAVGTVYLAKITKYVGIGDEITAILTAFVSLGCSFQLFSIFLGGKTSVKRFVSAGHIVSQLLFTCLYIIPLLGISSGVKTAVLVFALLAAQIIHNLVNAPKINWFMSMVQNEERGRFTAVKEIVSLVGGTLFSYALSFAIDRFEARGNLRGAFVVGAILLGSLTLLHTLTLIFSKEPKRESAAQSHNMKRLMKNKTLLKLIPVATMWIAANYATASFSGTYMNNELGFSLTFSSTVVLIGSLCRVLFSVPFGKFADKKGFRPMLVTCCSVAAGAYFLNIFTCPANGKVLYPIYYGLHCISMAGINSAMINLIYDYVQPEDRTGALALNQSVSGVAGFLVTLALTPAMKAIRGRGNVIFGRTVYAQQIFSGVSLLIVAVLITYLCTVIKKLTRADKVVLDKAATAAATAAGDTALNEAAATEK